MAITRIAMWSGPRNISTALMRAFENRSDCCVVDEPFYGYYLEQTGFEHPGGEQIKATMDCDWRSIARDLCESQPVPGDYSVYYQKHMSQHILPDMDMGYTRQLRNCFLIREPRRIIASYAKVRSDFTLAELGFVQQWELFDAEAQRLGVAPAVVDSAATLAAPEKTLRKLCEHLDIPFSERMLSWPAGKRDSDGVWAPHWYAAVEQFTGFQAPTETPLAEVEIPPQYEEMCVEAQRIYAELYEHALTKA